MSNPAFRILELGDENALEAFLLPRVESSMFLLSNMRTSGLIDGTEPYEGTYAAAFEGDQIVGVAAHYWNGNLVLQAPRAQDTLGRTAVRASGRPIRGLIGPRDQVGIVRQALDIDSTLIQMDETEKLYSLDLEALIIPKKLESGELIGRKIASSDLDTIAEMRAAFCIESLGDEDTPELYQSCRAEVERHLQEEITWVLEDRGTLVSTSSYNSATKEAVQIGGVYTPPRWRCRGFGRSVVAASLRDAHTNGVSKAILFTGEGNIPAQKAYQSLGFRHIGHYRLLLLGDVSILL